MSAPANWLTVLTAGPLTTVQDHGRIGLAHLGVPRAGALDQPAASLANRLVGNAPEAAVLELTLGGLEVQPVNGVWVAITGASAPAEVEGRHVGHQQACWVPGGATLRVGPPREGVRTYLALAGGIAVEPVLGSRATDTLAWIGPPPLRDGDRLPVGPAVGAPRPLDTPRSPRPRELRLHPGPHPWLFADDPRQALCEASYEVQVSSNRIGLRLSGPAIARSSGELASEGMVLGAVQVPPDSQPVVLLADHPPTGGYPVAAVVELEDLWLCAQLRPGDSVGFTPFR